MHNPLATTKQLDIIAQQVFPLLRGEEKVHTISPAGCLVAFIDRRIKTRFGNAWYTVSSCPDFNTLNVWDSTDKVDIHLPKEATAEELKTIMSQARDLFSQIKRTTNTTAA